MKTSDSLFSVCCFKSSELDEKAGPAVAKLKQMDDVSCCDFDFFLILDTFKILLTVQFIDIKIKTSCTVWTKNYPFPSPTGKDVSFFTKFTSRDMLF